MQDLKIDPEFSAYLPRHTPEERQRLEAQLLTEGCRDPIVIWQGQDIIVDGMERFSICCEHNIAFHTTELEFGTREAVKTWMSSNQISRRNLSGELYTLHLGRCYNAEKCKHGAPRRGQGTGKRTAEKLAEKEGVHPRTVLRAGKFAELVDAAAVVAPEVRAAINAGKKVTVKKLKDIAEAPKAVAEKMVKDIVEGKKPENLAESNGKDGAGAEDNDEREKKILDGLGKVVTDSRFLGVFSDRAVFEALLKQARVLESAVSRLSKSDGGVNLDVVFLNSAFKQIKAELADRIPMIRCPTCRGEKCVEKDGKSQECDPCIGSGFLSKFAYEHRRK
jgi:hypothetical protein